MAEGAQRIEFNNVKVVRDTEWILMCRVGTKDVGVPRRRMLAGTTIARRGDRGRLILTRELALSLGVVFEHWRVNTTLTGRA